MTRVPRVRLLADLSPVLMNRGHDCGYSTKDRTRHVKAKTPNRLSVMHKRLNSDVRSLEKKVPVLDIRLNVEAASMRLSNLFFSNGFHCVDCASDDLRVSRRVLVDPQKEVRPDNHGRARERHEDDYPVRFHEPMVLKSTTQGASRIIKT